MRSKMLLDLRTAIEKKNLVLFCGAGISNSAPSNLPLAKQLTQQIISTVLRIPINPITLNTLRPEVVFQRIQEYNETKLLSSLENILESKYFNQNHLLAALLLKKNINVITTNFDTLIEQACSYLQIKYSKTIFKKEWEPTLYKIHGCIEKKDSLRLSINQVNTGLPLWKSSLLMDLVKGKTLLVLGYSGLDQLDILPVLKQCDPKQIVWINHSTGKSANRSPSKWIKHLPHLNYVSYDTTKLSDELLRFLQKNNKKNTSLSKYDSEIVYIELLEHQNRYTDILSFIKKSNYKSDLRFRIFRLVSAGSSAVRPKNYASLKNSVTAEAFRKARFAQKGTLTFMGDAANNPKYWEIIEKVIDDRLQSKSHDYFLLESIIGYLPWMIHQNKFSKAKMYLKKIEPIVQKYGYTLLQIRVAISEGQIMMREMEHGIKNKNNYNLLLKKIENAMFLASEDIFNDAFFYYKASLVKSFILIQKGKKNMAEPLLDKAIKYFKSISVNNHIDALQIYANLHIKNNDKIIAVQYLNKAIKLNHKFHRSYLLGDLLRKKAILLKDRNSKLTMKLLKDALCIFQNQFLFKEAKFTEKIIRTM